MADRDVVDRLARALPEVEPKRHFHLDGYGVAGKSFATLEKGGERLMLSLPAPEAEAIVASHGDVAALLRRNDKPIGIAVTLADADESRLAEWLRSSWAFKAPKALRDKE